MKKSFLLYLVLFLSASSLFSQNYERYKKPIDSTIFSKHLDFEKNISITLPIEWQADIDKDFPLIIIFDRQNPRSHNYIIQAIDYLTSNEQMPASVIISVESTEEYRFKETSHQVSNPNGLAMENEKFIFEKLITLAEQNYKASKFRMLIGHSRYGYFTTALFHSSIENLNAVISMSPFFFQKNVSLTDSLLSLNNYTFTSKKYYRFGIGNDYPEDFEAMYEMLKHIDNPNLNMNGQLFKEADHNVTPGLVIITALYEIFEDWAAISNKYFSNEQKDLADKPLFEKEIAAVYGTKIGLPLGVLNGKGWYFYSENQYEKAIEAWQLLLEDYPNFSEAYLYIIEAQIQLNQPFANTIKEFESSLKASTFYSVEEKTELETELQELLK